MEAEPIDNLYLALGQCFAIILCGYIAGRLKIITGIEANGLNTFVGTFALPSLIFLSLAKLDFSLVNWRFLFAILLAKSVVFCTVLILSLLISKPSNPSRAALFAIFTTQSNDFAIGYPMVNAIYKQTHPEYSAYLYLMAPISLAILNPIGFALLEIGKRNTEERIPPWQMIYAVIKGIILNPVLLMTVLGMGGNFLFDHKIPSFLSAILDVLGNAFSANALFLLGLMMVGKIHKLKGYALVIPGILISIKLLVLPLVIRESIIFLNLKENETHTRDLSTYGFLYGTIPTAPALFIFTLRYNVEIDLIASSVVACTFISAPLMFVSSKIIDTIDSGMTPDNYTHELNDFSFDTSVASAAACIWLLICFIMLKDKKYKNATHRYTMCLVIAQLTTAVGVIMWTKIDYKSTNSLLWYLQFMLITTGVYASRLWTVAISVTVLFLSSRSLDFVQNFQKWFYPIGWGVPILLVGLMCLFIPFNESTRTEFNNPNFQFGRIQAAITTAVLIFCFIVTLGCLVLQQRYRRRRSTSYSVLPTDVDAASSFSVNRSVVDVEDLATSSCNGPTNPDCNFPNGCPGDICRGTPEDNCDQCSDVEETLDSLADLQILRHVVFIIFLLCSMFIGLILSLGTLIMEKLTGIYAQLGFIDVALNFGQSLIAFAIFGLDPGLGRLGCWLRQLCEKSRSVNRLQLPHESALSTEAKAIRDQFKSSYLIECRSRISMCRRRMLRLYKSVFSGNDLVNWLLEVGLAQTREEAVQYGQSLLESRVLQHVDGNHHFYDKNFLYSFNE